MTDKQGKYTLTLMQRIHKIDFPSDKIFLTAETDNRRIPIHTLVLAAASKYFSASLSSSFQDGGYEEFVMLDTEGDTVEALVDYCYTGKINLTETNVETFLSIASSFAFDLLEDECRQFYEANLNVDNCLSTFMVADKYSLANLRRASFDMIGENLDKASITEFKKLNDRLVKEILTDQRENATEDMVFERLWEWFRFNEEERAQHMPSLLKLIRLELISTEFLNDTIEVALKTLNCSDLVIAEYKRRISAQCSISAGRRCRSSSLFCLFAQWNGYDDAQESAIKIARFDFVSNTFEDATVISLGNRIRFGTAMHRNKIYVFGGFDLDDMHLKSASAYDLDSGEEEILPEMNFERSYFPAISSGKYIYIFGGWNGCRLAKSERFDTETKTWSIIKEMTIGRNNHSVAQLGEYLCVAGDFGSADSSQSLELYDSTDDQWTQLSRMNRPRCDFALTKSRGWLYAIGDDASVERFDSWKNIWTTMGSFEGSEHVTNMIDIDGVLYAIKTNGEFGRLLVEQSGKCSFDLLCKLEYEASMGGQHFLYQTEF